MTFKRVLEVFALASVGIALMLAVTVLHIPQKLVGRVLEGDELLRVQRQSDWDGDLDIDFLDFTVFSSFYEEGA